MKIRSSHSVLIVGVLAVMAAFLSAGASVASAETVNICPHKIVLNAQGNSEDVQAIVSMALPSARIDSFDVTLSLKGEEVASAESAFYCAADENLIVGFDRQELQESPVVVGLAGETVVATVAGSVTVELSDGSLVTRGFAGSDTVEIVAPGNKK